MTAGSALEAYLSDHMAGSVSASDLARRGAKNNDGPVGVFFADLAREIELDRRTLSEVASRVGAQPHPVKQAGRWRLNGSAGSRLITG